MPPAPRILIVGPSWVGDMVMAQSLFLASSSAIPTAPSTYWRPPGPCRCCSACRKWRGGVAMPLGHGQFGFGARRQLGLELRGRYDWAIVLPNSWKSALTPFFAKIPKRTGYVGELRYGLLNDARKLDKAKLPKTVQRFVALGLEPDAAL
ncbi:lipopolysaccharide heptosyltransferase II, partial [Methylogaea oryzae]|uniref:lipopolysaccharide heptosyltransferase II n=1 Tax=Methylogaea oryzae TaxID=1295382 RepID=UPI0020D0C59C